MSRLKNLFKQKKPYVIGMIHLKALPGTPNANYSISQLIDQAVKDAEIYKSCNLDSVLIENMHDVPYIQPHLMEPEVTASMTRICSEIRRILPKTITCGVQILAGANKEAIAVAQAAELQFIRAEGFIFSHIADEGLMNSCAGDLLRYRKAIGADEVGILTDIKKKHCSHIITSDVSLKETAEAAEFFKSDGIVLTGKATGDPANISDLKEVKKATTLPIIIGSGVTVNNIHEYLEADAFIIGSHFKKNGKWENEIDEERVQKFMSVIKEKQQSRS